MEKIDKTIEILQAFKEDKIVQYGQCNKWFDYTEDLRSLLMDLSKNFDWRIKPEPTYRPYKNSDEFLKASQEHGHYIYSCPRYKDYPIRVLDEGIALIDFVNYTKSSNYEISFYSYDSLLKRFKWLDNTPCGILEQ